MTALQSWNLTTLPISGRNLLDLNLAFLLIKVVSLCSSEPHPLRLLFLHCFVVRLLFTGENRGSIHLCHSVGGDQHWGTGSMSQRAKGSLKKENLPCQSLKAGHPEHARFFFLSQSWALCTMNMSPTLRRSAQSSTVTSRGVRSKTFSPNHWDLDQMAPWKCLSFSKSLNSIKKEKRKEKKQPCWSSLQRCPRRPSRRANFLILFNAELGLERNKCDPVVRWHNSLVYSFIVKIKSQLTVKHNTFGCLNIDL